MVWPTGKVLPDTGPEVWAMVDPAQVVASVGGFQVTTAAHAPAGTFTEIVPDGQPVIAGAELSTTGTAKEHELLKPLFDAVTVTFWFPGPTCVPAAGDCTITAPGQLSETVADVV